VFRRSSLTVDCHVPEHPSLTVYGMLYVLVGKCLTLNFWDLWSALRKWGAKSVAIRDRGYNTVFVSKYVFGGQSFVLDALRTYSFKIYGSKAYASDLITAVDKVRGKIESCESSFLIISQMPYGGGSVLFKGLDRCPFNSFRIPDLTRINSLSNELEPEKVVVKDFLDELYVAGLDKMVLTFMYWRNLGSPPRPAFEEVKVGEQGGSGSV